MTGLARGLSSLRSMASTTIPPDWKPVVYFWDGGWFAVGRSLGAVPPHSHHAVQISIGLDGPVKFRDPDGPWQEFEGAAILPDVAHAFDGCDTLVTMLFVDPDGPEGRWLRLSLRTPIAGIPRERVAEYLPAMRSFPADRPDPATAARLISGVVRAICVGSPALKQLDDRIVRALELIRQGDVRRLPLAAVAKAVYLSPSRFAHLFTEEVGLPFRRYVLWRKLNRAMAAFGRGGNLSEAAHEAGFADSAHLTRSWNQMFGIPPTVMMGRAEFHEIPAPFQRNGAAA